MSSIYPEDSSESTTVDTNHRNRITKPTIFRKIFVFQTHCGFPCWFLSRSSTFWYLLLFLSFPIRNQFAFRLTVFIRLFVNQLLSPIKFNFRFYLQFFTNRIAAVYHRHSTASCFVRSAFTAKFRSSILFLAPICLSPMQSEGMSNRFLEIISQNFGDKNFGRYPLDEWRSVGSNPSEALVIRMIGDQNFFGKNFWW